MAGPTARHGGRRHSLISNFQLFAFLGPLTRCPDKVGGGRLAPGRREGGRPWGRRVPSMQVPKLAGDAGRDRKGLSTRLVLAMALRRG